MMPKRTRKVDAQWRLAIRKIQESNDPTLEILKVALRQIDPDAAIEECVELRYTAQLPSGHVIQELVLGEWVPAEVGRDRNGRKEDQTE